MIKKIFLRHNKFFVYMYITKVIHVLLSIFLLAFNQRKVRTQSPTNKNDAFELPTLGVIVEFSPTVVQ